MDFCTLFDSCLSDFATLLLQLYLGKPHSRDLQKRMALKLIHKQSQSDWKPVPIGVMSKLFH